jgi:hypothetical protein
MIYHVLAFNSTNELLTSIVITRIESEFETDLATTQVHNFICQ